LDAEIPLAYPADHVSLLLEYASLLLETADTATYAAFHEACFA
jgi:TorA maturation chaperone TorD